MSENSKSDKFILNPFFVHIKSYVVLRSPQQLPLLSTPRLFNIMKITIVSRSTYYYIQQQRNNMLQH